MTSTSTTTAPAKSLRESRKEQAVVKKPAPAKAPAKAAAAKPAVAKTTKPAVEKPAVEAKKYSATARCGRVNTRASVTPLLAALDVKISGRKGAHYTAGVIVGFFATVEAAQKAADDINSGNVTDWSDAIVVTTKAVS